MIRLTPVLLLSLCAAGCFATRVVGPPVPMVPDRVPPTTVVLEPFFEMAEWKVSTKTENQRVFNSFGPPQDVVVEKQVAEKPVFARVPVLAQEHLAVLERIRVLRPSWNVLSTGQLPQSGPVVLVRTVIGQSELAGSDRTFKSILTGLGLGIPGLFLRVNEAQRVYGGLTRYEADAAALRPRLLRYPTQPDYAVDIRGLTQTQQAFGLEMEYEEGVMAADLDRERALVADFCQRLAVAIIALVEGIP